MEENKNFYDIVERIAVKYAELLEAHLNNISEDNLDSVYDDIRLLGNISSCLCKSSNKD